jgi:hypothetical protein
MKWLLLTLLKGYRLIVSPWYGQTCRYYPSCSAYAVAAVQRHGTVKGVWLTVRRLARCHPWCPGGVDFVPTCDTFRWWGRAEGTDGKASQPRGSGGTFAPAAGPSSGAITIRRGA